MPVTSLARTSYPCASRSATTARPAFPAAPVTATVVMGGSCHLRSGRPRTFAADPVEFVLLRGPRARTHHREAVPRVLRGPAAGPRRSARDHLAVAAGGTSSRD